MSKHFKSALKQKDEKICDEETEDLDLRLERQIFLSSELQREVIFCRDELEYCAQFLTTLKEEHKRIGKHYLFNKSSPFGGWENKLKPLTVSAIENDSNAGKQGNKENKNIQMKQGQCSQKKHLEDILADKVRKTEEDQITQLQEKLENLYGRIGDAVMEEYMNDKIVLKIKREAKKASKEKTLVHMEKQITKYRNWVAQKNKNINNKIVAQQVEDKILHNLEFMKLLMNKKIINNDYIYEQFQENQAQNGKIIDKMGLLTNQIQQRYQQSRKMFQEKIIESTSDKNHNKKANKRQIKPFNLELVENYLRDVEGTLQQLDEYEAEDKLNEEGHILTSKLSSMSSSFKK